MMSDSSTECIYGNCEIYDLLKENCKCKCITDKESSGD